MSRFNQLLDAVMNKENKDRSADLEGLSYMDDGRIVTVLNKIVSDQNEDDDMRWGALELLEEKGNTTSLPILKAYDEDAIKKFGRFSLQAQKADIVMLAIYQREFPPEHAPAMKAAVTAKSESKLPFLRADVIMPSESAQIS